MSGLSDAYGVNRDYTHIQYLIIYLSNLIIQSEKKVHLVLYGKRNHLVVLKPGLIGKHIVRTKFECFLWFSFKILKSVLLLIWLHFI